jgi:hypothetical protein
MRKEEVKGLNKCKIAKDYGKKAAMWVEKRRVANRGKISFSEGGGNKYPFSDRNIDLCIDLLAQSRPLLYLAGHPL